MIARWVFLLLLLLAGAAAAQSGVPDHRWGAFKVDAARWRAAVAPPRAMVAPSQLQMTVTVDVLCYPLANGLELRLHYSDFDLGGERRRQPDVTARIDGDPPVRMVWAGRGDWVSDPLPPSFARRMRSGRSIIVDWGAYVPVRRGDPLRLHLRGSAAAFDALPSLCR
ncbi:MAG: hypothetical protein AB7O88_16035 [Reyranellaceae bacterium]